MGSVLLMVSGGFGACECEKGSVGVLRYRDAKDGFMFL